VTTREEADQHLVDHLALTDHDTPHGVAQRLRLLSEMLDPPVSLDLSHDSLPPTPKRGSREHAARRAHSSKYVRTCSR